jgi:hypothetical protein
LGGTVEIRTTAVPRVMGATRVVPVFAFAIVIAMALGVTGCSGGASSADADTHWKAAVTAFGTIRSTSQTLSSTGSGYDATVVPGLATTLTRVRPILAKELDGLDAAVAAMSDGASKTSWASAAKNARAALDGAMKAEPVLTIVGPLMAQAKTVNIGMNDAADLIGSAVKANNKGSWNSAVSSATKALAECSKATATLNGIKKTVAAQPGMTDDGEIANALKYVAMERAMAQDTLDAARGMKAGSYSRYSAALDKYNKAADAYNAADTPLLLDDPSFLADQAREALNAATVLFGTAESDQRGAAGGAAK